MNHMDSSIPSSLQQVWDDAGPATGQGVEALPPSAWRRVLVLGLHARSFTSFSQFPRSARLCRTDTAGLWAVRHRLGLLAADSLLGKIVT